MAGAIPVQTQEDIVPPAALPIGYRLAGVLLAPAVAATMHTILTGPFGLELATPSGLGSAELEPLGILTTTLVTLVLSLLAWISVTLLERGLGKEKGRSIWMKVGIGVFVVSLFPILPLDLTVGAKWGMAALHAAVAVVLVPTMTARGQG